LIEGNFFSPGQENEIKIKIAIKRNTAKKLFHKGTKFFRFMTMKKFSYNLIQLKYECVIQQKKLPS
jgi:hypothetical protein